MNVIFTRDFLALILSVAVVGLGSGATLPLTSLALTQAGYGTDVVGLLAAAQAGGGLIVVPLAGWVAARFSGRQVIVGAVLTVGVATALMQFTSNLWLWAALRILCGAALMLLFTISEAWVNQLADDATRARVIAIYATNFTLFQMSGPVLVSQIADFMHWRFLICGAIFLLALPALASIRKTPQASKDEHTAHGSWRHVLPQMPVLVIGTAFFALFDTIALSLLPLFAMSHGVTSEVAVLFASALLLGDTTMQFPIGWLADRLGRERVHIGCGVIVVVLLPLLPWAVNSPWSCWPLLYVLGATAGAIYTLSMAACGERFRGVALVSASSLVGASWSAASFGGPLVAGALMKGVGNDAMVGVLVVAALAFLGAVWWERRRAPMRVVGS
ncbi:MFS transporter permease [Paraburkholderia caffeinilytica]|uniref:MFS transporter n=1 Tax=Paraburkholderia caffeinilytica TaxID=1761016 RepID=A0ABQ1N8A5_9BURK|nr:MFS transporter [Paraburkholderia caffeinilytica]AXL52800.1 MFS transporter permease [Paraburkholderia caffeinilytica]GGC59384.1 MFS transporter [Paraburkholderia caffeinilytica]CAB3803304.1 putative MFS-type transporter YcaD [Paraburkholderia caffeinilytica]